MTALQRLVGLIWGFPPVRILAGALSFLKEGRRAQSEARRLTRTNGRDRAMAENFAPALNLLQR
jgi:hypothetical protein